MKNPHYMATMALGLISLSGHAWATTTNTPGPSGMRELSDASLANMRGRWTPPGTTNTVAYFGVTMNSTWNAASGQQLASSMTLGMNFDTSGNVQMTIMPTVTIVNTSVPAVAAATTNGTSNHTVDSSGLSNVSGLAQGVQIAGDNNVADNVTSLTVNGTSDTTAPPGSTPYNGQSQTFTVSNGDANATASISNQGMQVSLTIAGQGQVQQWINSSSLGQLVALGSDGQSVQNHLDIQLVQRSLTASANLNRDLMQSVNLVRGMDMGY